MVLLLLCATFYSNFSSIVNTNGWNIHSWRVIDKSRALTQSLVNMETGLRGYAINGKEEMLAPWNSGKEDFVTFLQETKALTAITRRSRASGYIAEPGAGVEREVCH